MHVRNLALFTLSALTLATAQDKPATAPKEPEKKEKPTPTLPEPLITEYYKSVANKLRAESVVKDMPQFKNLKDTDTALGVTMGKIQGACGTDFLVSFKDNGDPKCIAKPPATPPPAPVKEKK